MNSPSFARLLQPGQWYPLSRHYTELTLLEPGVYFIRAQGGPDSVYVGKSDKLRGRLQDHLRSIEVVQQLLGINANWEFRIIPTSNPCALEYALIRGYEGKVVNQRVTGEEAYRAVEKLASGQ